MRNAGLSKLILYSLKPSQTSKLLFVDVYLLTKEQNTIDYIL